jgi:hypothetical protein
MFDFITGLTDALASVASEIEALVIYLFEVLISVLKFLWLVIQVIANFLVTVVNDIGKFFQHLWDNFFKGIFNSVLKGIVNFGRWLKQIFGPVVKFLRTVSKYIDRIYRRYAVPILRILRITRVFLTLLKALHVKWAGKLDAILGTIQTDIQRAFLTVKAYLNVVIDLLNILSDPTNLLRKPTTLLSLRRVLHAAIRQFTGLPPGFFIPSGKAGTPYGLGFIPANFDANNPVTNPPPSYYLALDSGVPSFDFLNPGDTIPDTAVDDLDTLDYFDNLLIDDIICDDPVQCMSDAARLAMAGR